MKVIAYVYFEPLIEASPEPLSWGWQVDQVYRDIGDRHQLQQLIQACQTDAVDYVLVQRLQDLGNSLADIAARLTELEVAGVQLVAIESALGTPGYLPPNRVDLIQLLQTIQHEQHSRQIRKGHARNRIKALPPPGKAPYGYKRGKDRYVIDRTVAPVVKDFFEHFLLYGSLRGAVRYLEKKYSKKISASTGHRWLVNPVYRGDLEYQEQQVISNTHTPIISREEAAQVDRLLRRNRRLPPRTASAPRSLAGLVTCAECTTRLTVSRVTIPRSKQTYLYLRPSACPKRPKCSSVPYEQVLGETIQGICRELPHAVAQINLSGMNSVKQSLAGAIIQKQQVLDQIPALVDSNILDPETAELRAYKLRIEISEVQGKIAQLPPTNLPEIAQTVSIPQFWLDLSESERRFYFREFIRQIRLIRQPEGWQLELVFIF